MVSGTIQRERITGPSVLCSKGCGRAVHARGLCGSHYTEQYQAALMAAPETCRLCTRPVRNKSRKLCKHGHKFTPENTYLRPDGGGRGCRTCIQARNASRRKVKVAA